MAGRGGGLFDSLLFGDLTSAANPPDGPDLFRGGGGSDPGLNIWSMTPDFDLSFTAGLVAFTGSGTWSLSPAEYADMLAGNSSGDIHFPADTLDDLPVSILGTYSVVSDATVPEPASISLIGLGLLGLVVLRKRR